MKVAGSHSRPLAPPSRPFGVRLSDQLQLRHRRLSQHRQRQLSRACSPAKVRTATPPTRGHAFLLVSRMWTAEAVEEMVPTTSRTIDLDTETVTVLRSQKVTIAEQRLAWGEGYSDHGLLFPREDGQPRRPDSVSKEFVRLVAVAVKAGIVARRISLHSLRHTHGSIGIAAGIPVKVMAERLGHSSPAFTMSVYQHVLPSMQAETAAIIARTISAASEDGESTSSALESHEA